MSLSSIARSKLSLSDSSNLHRWVLLKNSLMASAPSKPDTDPESPTPPNSPTAASHPDPQRAFMFPTYYSYDQQDAQTRSSEALWLDTLLESLAHDEEDDEVEDDPPIEEEEDDDDDSLSPMSSSDDLTYHRPFIPYYQPPPPQQAPLAPLPLTLPFPFSDLDSIDDSSDDGDDPLKSSSCSESTPSTSPSSSASSLPATPPSSPLRSWAVPKIPLPPSNPHMYIDAYSDPLPFSHTFSYDIECPFVFHLS